MPISPRSALSCGSKSAIAMPCDCITAPHSGFSPSSEPSPLGAESTPFADDASNSTMIDRSRSSQGASPPEAIPSAVSKPPPTTPVGPIACARSRCHARDFAADRAAAMAWAAANGMCGGAAAWKVADQSASSPSEPSEVTPRARTVAGSGAVDTRLSHLGLVSGVASTALLLPASVALSATSVASAGTSLGHAALCARPFGGTYEVHALASARCSSCSKSSTCDAGTALAPLSGCGGSEDGFAAGCSERRRASSCFHCSAFWASALNSLICDSSCCCAASPIFFSSSVRPSPASPLDH
eukprot:scaffold64698_cov35-Tisochrysis_lutea.AAC.1